MSDPMDVIREVRASSKDELIRILLDDAKNWLAHDGLWFQLWCAWEFRLQGSSSDG